MNWFVINHKLPSLNDYINVCRRNKYQAAQFKKDVDEVIGWAIRQALAKGTLKPTKEPCQIIFTWIEENARRDCDNIASAKKYILDAMQKQGIIPNDNQKYIKGFMDDFQRGKSCGVKVEILELTGGEEECM